MKKNIAWLVLCFLIVSLAASAAEAQTKVIKKTVKKVVTPQISPVTPPFVATPEVVEDVPAPPPPPDFSLSVPQEKKGLFGWGWNADLGAKLLYGSIALGARGDLIFDDPLKIGSGVGLAEDAVEYRVGLGAVIGDKFKSIPLYADATVYLKEGSLFGLDPFFGLGLIMNLYGTGKASGGLGGQLFGGFLADLGMESRTGFSLGYATYKIGDLTNNGITLSVVQPFKL